mmetsp:Transcript_14056/g.38418  ORF Transcript_14056/g.38418 Transcript_14056/m.38418 type:complete len:388 (-) Transcript_14056:2310-3473(-)
MSSMRTGKDKAWWLMMFLRVWAKGNISSVYPKAFASTRPTYAAHDKMPAMSLTGIVCNGSASNGSRITRASATVQLSHAKSSWSAWTPSSAACSRMPAQTADNTAWGLLPCEHAAAYCSWNCSGVQGHSSLAISGLGMRDASSGMCMFGPSGCCCQMPAAIIQRWSRSAQWANIFTTMGSLGCCSSSATTWASTYSCARASVATHRADAETPRKHIAAFTGSPLSAYRAASSAATSSKRCLATLFAAGGLSDADSRSPAITPGRRPSLSDFAMTKAVSRSPRETHSSMYLGALPVATQYGDTSSISAAFKVSTYSLHISTQNWWLTAGAMLIARSHWPACAVKRQYCRKSPMRSMICAALSSLSSCFIERPIVARADASSNALDLWH